MRKFVIAAGAVMALSGAVASAAGAASNPAGTGQPGVAQPNGADFQHRSRVDAAAGLCDRWLCQGREVFTPTPGRRAATRRTRSLSTTSPATSRPRTTEASLRLPPWNPVPPQRAHTAPRVRLRSARGGRCTHD